MAAHERDVPDSHDPLGEILHLLQLSGSLYCRSEMTAPWGIDLPPFEGWMMFHVVLSGRCVLEVRGAEPMVLERGSLALIPHGHGHVLRSAPEADATPLFDIPVERIGDRYEVLRHGGGGERADLICVVARFDHVAAAHLLEQLPAALRLDPMAEGLGADGGGWLQSTLQFIAREARAQRPGGETIITRLADVLVIQMIRSWIDTSPEAEQGWLAALRDPQLGRALSAIHRSPEKPWSVATLAEEACMSRSAFSARFTERLGVSVGRYMTRWRMLVARSRLLASDVPLATLADGLGYASEAAFCRAFKRELGESPGSVRRGAKNAPLAPTSA